MVLTGFFFEKRLFHFIWSVIFPTRNLILMSLETHKKGKGCLYNKKLADVDLKVLEEIIKTSVMLTVKKDQ